MSMPAVGDPAPEVALPDETGTVHRLADQRGRWTILYFYPKDDTPGCTVEACEFRDANETITERGADVWGISPQGAPSKKAFREKFGLPFTLLADEDHAVAEAYGSWVEKQNYGKTYWAPRGRRSWSTPTGGSPRSGRRSSRKATPPTSWRRSTSCSAPDDPRGAICREAGGFARGGRRAKPRPEAYARRVRRTRNGVRA